MAVKKEKAKPTDIYTPEVLEKRRRYLFNICQSKEELHAFLKAFLKVDLPNYIVDENSTSSPMDFVWAVYDVMRTNVGPKEHAVAAARGTMKTLTSAIIHFLAMVHFRRSCVQISALKPQSRFCLQYLSKFLNIPELIEYFETHSAYEYMLNNLPANSFTSKPDAKVSVTAATIAAANGLRGSLLCRDETDLIKREILDEVSMVAEPTQCGNAFDPITVSLSSRKTNSGPIQDLIEKAELEENAGVIALHKWSLADFMKKCEPEYHGPKIHKAFINDDTLQIIWDEEEKENLSLASFRTIEAYDKCKGCKAFLVCQTRSANQKSTAPGLRKISFVAGRISDVKDITKIKAQLLNLEPETTGLVFPLLSKGLHYKKPEDVFLFMSGQNWYEYANINIEKGYKKPPTKRDLYEYAQAKGWKINFGIDFGFTDPAVIVAVLYNRRTNHCVILHGRHSPGYSNSQWAETIKQNECLSLSPDMICPDMADASAHTYFAPDGYAVWRNKPKTIDQGVSQLRGLMWDPATQKSHFIIADFDEESKWIFECFSKWSHKKSVTGTFDMSSYEDDEYTHPIDSVRYALEPFRVHIEARITASSAKPSTDNVSSVMQAVNKTYRDAGAHVPDIMGDAILQAYRDAGLEKHIVDDPGVSKKADKKKSSFKFSF